MRSAITGLVLMLAILTSANAARDPRAGKKLIEYGWDVPTPAFLKANVQKMEQVPFDGVVIRLLTYRTHNGGPEVLGWKVFSDYRIQPGDYQHSLDDMKSIQFTRLRDNFIEVCSNPGDVDFFDPKWDNAVHNIGCMAKIAKESGCVGIMFDPEIYGPFPTWSYMRRPEEQRKAHTYEQYCARVRECGRKVMKAINRELPDAKILALYGYCMPYVEVTLWNGGKGLEYASYGLLPAFYDGMLDAATPSTVFIDGHEFSYGYANRKQYMEARKRVLQESKTLSQYPDEYMEHVRVGLGVWADMDHRTFGWNPDDFSKNYWTPGAFRTALSHALSLSDEYVWVYSEKLRWWDFNVPKEYIDALALARTGPGPEEGGCPYPKGAARAAELTGYSDAETFAKYKNQTEALDIPKDAWLFSRDVNDQGKTAGWYKPEFDDSKWRSISIGKFWDEQNETLNGIGWYRTRFTAPSVKSGKTVLLVFGAVDESAWVWLNGEPVGSHDIGGAGWSDPFEMDVTKALKPDAENVLVVRVFNNFGPGGIWKSIKLFAK